MKKSPSAKSLAKRVGVVAVSVLTAVSMVAAGAVSLSALTSPAADASDSDIVASGADGNYTWTLATDGALELAAGASDGQTGYAWKDQEVKVSTVTVGRDVQLDKAFGEALAGVEELNGLDLKDVKAADIADVCSAMHSGFTCGVVACGEGKGRLSSAKEALEAATEWKWLKLDDAHLRPADTDEMYDDGDDDPSVDEDDTGHGVIFRGIDEDPDVFGLDKKSDKKDSDEDEGSETDTVTDDSATAGSSDSDSSEGSKPKSGKSSDGTVSDSVAAIPASSALDASELIPATYRLDGEAASAKHAIANSDNQASAKLANVTSYQEDLTSSGVTNQSSTINLDSDRGLRIDDANCTYTETREKAFGRKKLTYKERAANEDIYGVAVKFSEYSKDRGDSFTLRWNNIGWDNSGNRVDLSLTFSNFTFNFDSKKTKPSQVHVCGNFPGDKKLYLLAYDPLNDSKFGAKYHVEGHIYKTGTNTAASGRYLMLVKDIDQPSKVPGKDNEVGGKWAERVELGAGSNTPAYISKNTYLNTDKAKVGNFVSKTKDGSSTGDVRAAFADNLNASTFKFTWTGSRAGTALLGQVTPHKIYKKTDTGGRLSARASTAGSAGSNMSSFTSGNDYDLVGHNSNAYYKAAAASGYYITAIKSDGNAQDFVDNIVPYTSIVADHRIEVTTAPIKSLENFTPNQIAYKKLTGRTLQANQFSFQVDEVDTDGTVVTEKVSAPRNGAPDNDNKGEIKITMPTYTFEDVGKTFRYRITEVIPDAAKNNGNKANGYTYDASAKYFTVTIGLNEKQGQVTATSAWEASGASGYTFTNSYAATGSFTPTVTKQVANKAIGDLKFTFQMTGPKTSAQTKTNDTSGKVTFDTINVTQADLDKDGTKTLTYNIQETGSKPGWTYDSEKCTLTVNLKDNGNGTISCTESYSHRTFTNTYKANGSVHVNLAKAIEIGPAGFENAVNLNRSGYQFVVTNSSGTQITSGTSDLNGTAAVDIGFSIPSSTTSPGPGTYTYNIRETAGTLDGMEYDSHVYQVTVKVTDNNDGTLKTETTYSGSSTFTNKYTARGGLKLLKVSDVNVPLAGARFGIYKNRTDTTAVATMTSGADGIASTANNKLELGKYYVKELSAPTGYDVNLDYVAEVNVVKDHEIVQADTCVDTEGSSTLAITARKTLTGSTLVENQFEFELYDTDPSSNASATPISAAKNDENGNVTFATLAYRASDLPTSGAARKNITYYVKEKAPTGTDPINGWTYDRSVKQVVVQLTKDANGRPSAKITSGENPTFANSYTASGTAKINGTVTMQGRSLVANEFGFKLYDENHNAISSTIRNGAPTDGVGKFAFSDVTFTQADLGPNGTGAKTYYVEQDCGVDENGLVYDRSIKEITIQLSDDRMGHISATPATTTVTFVNEYKATGSVTPQLKKVLKGKDFDESDPFTFQLHDPEDSTKILQTVTNDADGNIVFDALEYTQANAGADASHKKTINYTISEVNDNKPWTTYESEPLTLTVSLYDNGVGRVVCEASYPNGDTFTNKYTSHGGVMTKKVDNEGNPLAGARIGVYRTGQASSSTPLVVMISDDEGIASTATRDLEGGDYYLHEITGPAGYMIDATWAPTFSITQDDVIVDLTDAAHQCVDAPKAGAAQISAVKDLQNATLEAGAFTFQLLDAQHRVIQEKSCDAQGRVYFDSLNFTKDDIGQTFSYTVREKIPATADRIDGMDYDEHTEAVSVTVAEGAEGLAVSVNYEDWRGESVSNPEDYKWDINAGASFDLYYLVKDGKILYGNMESEEIARNVKNTVANEENGLDSAQIIIGSDLLDTLYAFDSSSGGDFDKYYLANAETGNILYGPFDDTELPTVLKDTIVAEEGGEMPPDLVVVNGFEAVYDIEATKLYYSKAAYENGTYNSTVGSAFTDHVWMDPADDYEFSANAGLFDFAYYMKNLVDTQQYGYNLHSGYYDQQASNYSSHPDLVLIKRDGTKERVTATMAAAFTNPLNNQDMDATITFSNSAAVKDLYIVDDDASKLTNGRYSYNGNDQSDDHYEANLVWYDLDTNQHGSYISDHSMVSRDLASGGEGSIIMQLGDSAGTTIAVGEYYYKPQCIRAMQISLMAYAMENYSSSVTADVSADINIQEKIYRNGEEDSANEIGYYSNSWYESNYYIGNDTYVYISLYNSYNGTYFNWDYNKNYYPYSGRARFYISSTLASKLSSAGINRMIGTTDNILYNSDYGDAYFEIDSTYDNASGWANLIGGSEGYSPSYY